MTATRKYASSTPAAATPSARRARGSRRSQPNQEAGQPQRMGRDSLLWLGLILLPVVVTLALIAWKQEPFRDEAVTLLAVEGVLKTGLPTMPNGSLYGHGVFWTYIAAIPGFLFGVHMWSVRLASVIAGVVIVAIVFLLSRRLFGDKAAAWAAFLTFANAKVLYFSSIGRMYAGAMLFIGITVILLALWIKEERPRWLWLAGASYAAGVLTYEIAPYYALAAALCLPLAVPRSRLLEWRLLAIGFLAAGATLLRLLLLRVWEPTVVATITAAFKPSLEFGSREIYMLQQFFSSDLPMIALMVIFVMSAILSLRLPWARYLAAVAVAASVLVVVMPGNEATRYLLPMVPLLTVVAGYGLSRIIPGRRGLPAAIAAYGLLTLATLSIYNGTSGEVRSFFLPSVDSNGWIAAAEATKPLIKQDDAIVASEPRNIYWVLRRLDGFILPQQSHMVVNGKNIHIDVPLVSGRDVWKMAESRAVWIFAQDSRVRNSTYEDLIALIGGREVLDRQHVYVYKIARTRKLQRREKLRLAIERDAVYLASELAVTRDDYSLAGKGLIAKGDPRTAVRFVRSGLDIYGGDPVLLTDLAAAYGKLGRSDAVLSIQTRLRRQEEAARDRR